VLLREATLEGIRSGAVKLVFRRWWRPTVRSGGTLMTPVGQLEIVSVTPATAAAISENDARLAGYRSRDALLAELEQREGGELYRIELGALRPDPRVALRNSEMLDANELAALRTKLERLDARSDGGPWTLRVLALIAEHPGTRAAVLAQRANQETPRFKLNVRKLKALGLTESLEIGYRISPRGRALLERLKDEATVNRAR
jgi:hypothetical protein